VPANQRRNRANAMCCKGRTGVLGAVALAHQGKKPAK